MSRRVVNGADTTFPREHVERMRDLLLKHDRTAQEDAELNVLATMLHVYSGGKFSIVLDGDIHGGSPR